MFEALSAKVFSTLASVSMFLFSSYTGNDPGLTTLRTRVGDNYLQVQTKLEQAFVNDFNEVFTSGVSIPVVFKFSINNGSNVLFEKRFVNRVRYDQAKGIYYFSAEGSNRNLEMGSQAQMITELSSFACSVPYNRRWGKVSVKVEASLSSVRFQQVKEPVDLMVLWKYHKPKVSASVDLTRVQ